MIRWFRKRRPAPPPAAPKISPEDLRIAIWWGYTQEQWTALPESVRTDKRLHCVYAPRF